MSEESKYLEGTVPIILYVPDNTVMAEVTVHMMDNDMNFSKAERKIGVKELSDAKIDGNEWESENVYYKLNEKFMEG